MSNENESKGAAKKVGGKLKEVAGKVTGNDRLKHEGQADQVEGSAQETAGKAQNAVTPDQKK